MTRKKNKLDRLTIEALDAAIARTREEVMLETLKREQQYLRENADAIDAALPFDDPIDETHPLFDQEVHSMAEEQPTVTKSISRIAAKFNDAFAAFVSDAAETLNRDMPMLLAAGVRSSRNAYFEKSKAAPGQEVIGRPERKTLPNWMPWPPVEDSKTAGTWVFFVDWYGQRTAPGAKPQVHIRVDGAEMDDPVVHSRNNGERLEFKVHCPKPLGFELEELETGALRMNLVTNVENLG